MPRRVLVLASLLVSALVADGPAPGEVSGPVAYTATGVKLGDKTWSWKAITALTETDPDVEVLRAEYARRAAAAKDTAALHLAIAKWCRENGLPEEARKEYEAAVAQEPTNVAAREGASFARDKDAWRPAKEVYAERLTALDPKKKGARLELAKWCREHSLFDEEWNLVVQLLVADAWDKAAIQQAIPITDRRIPKSPLRPPFEGRWEARVDRTGHHRIKCFAIYAIDFVKVDSDGKAFTGRGTRLEDHYAWDQEILAAADGVVTMADDHWKDLPAGVGGNFNEANFISIEHEGGEHTDYGHIKQGSARVKAGDRVKKGQPIARAGNSGASGTPHLHFTMSVAVFSPGFDHGQWLSVPYRFEDFDVVEANGAACSFHVNVARPQEGWVMVCPAPLGK